MGRIRNAEGCLLTNIRRGLRNIIRNRTRTIMVTVLLGIACALALTMLTAGDALDAEIARIEAGVGTLIEVAAPGSVGFFAALDLLLDQDLLAVVEATPGIESAHPLAMISLLRRSFGTGLQMPTAQTRAAPRLVMGVAPGGLLLVQGGSEIDLVAGRNLEAADDGELVAVLSRQYADSAGIGPGDVLTLLAPEEEREFVVAGLFDSDQILANRTVFIPLGTVQQLWGLEDQLTHIYAFAETIHAVDDAKALLIGQLGEQGEVSAQKDAMLGRLEDSLSGMTGAIRTTLVLSLMVAGVVVLFVMMMTVRERATEIGVLKAIGAARADIVAQFATEATALGLTGAVAGLAGFLLGGRVLGMWILQRATANPALDMAQREMGRFGETISERLGGGGMLGGGIGIPGLQGAGLGLSLGGLAAVLTWHSVVLIAGLACLLGLAGGLLPAIYAANLKPAEVLRRG